jgi:2-amino-4-hydroxy-6-hydroxymethyldihydropteridine diphosphokinase
VAEIYLLLGGNLGNREKNLERACSMVQQMVGPVIKRSSVYETEPWGFTHESCFLNQVLHVTTRLSPEELLRSVNAIEKQFGRKRTPEKYAARTMDIDVLFYNDLVLSDEQMTIPHPRLHERKFTLVPLYEIAPELIHPVFKKTTEQLLKECKDEMKVIPILNSN